jgi:cytochrome c-type biogenesis protein CcmH
VNILFVIISATLCLGTLILLLLPLLRASRRGAPSRAEFDVRLYRDQLAEVDRDAARGLLDPTEAEAARTEVKRRLLAAAAAVEIGGVGATPPGQRPRWVLPAFLALLLPFATALLYLGLGQPGSPDQPLAERRTKDMLTAGVTARQAKSLSDATTQLAKRLESRPNDATGWFLLGRSYLTMQRLPEAVRALARARQLAPEQPEYVGAYAEAAIAASGGRIDDNAHDALQTLLALDPSSAKARFLLALEKAQRGDLAGAVQDWADLAAIAPPDAPWLPTVREHLDRAASQAGIDPATVKPFAEAHAPEATLPPDAPGPNAKDIAAADRMNPEDRQRMIRGMVEGLATRLAEHPDDIEGWRRLARAWEVLGEPAKAADALARVAELERR